MKSIDSPIVSYEIVKDNEVKFDNSAAQVQEPITVKGTIELVVPEPLERPEVLHGSTYKVSPPTLENSLYININDIDDHDGTKRPFEIFFSSKDLQHNQWLVSLALMLTAIFRLTKDVDFIVNQLKGVKDPNGGYFRPKKANEEKGRYVPSLVWEIADVIEMHFAKLRQSQGIVIPMTISNIDPEMIKTALTGQIGKLQPVTDLIVEEAVNTTDILDTASDGVKGNAPCPKCHDPFGVIKQDGCENCLCGEYSKCG